MKTNSETWLQAIGRESSKALGLFSLSLGLGLLTCLPLSAQHRAGTPQHRTTTQAATPPKAVDMGVSVKWCDRNFGAASPKAGGGLYTWGDSTGTKVLSPTDEDVFGDSIPDDIGGTEYDPVTTKMGGNWRMPTVEEIDELINKCDWSIVPQNGIPLGIRVEARNGNSIYFPFPKIVLKGVNGAMKNPTNGSYSLWIWSSNLGKDDTDQAKAEAFIATHDDKMTYAAKETKRRFNYTLAPWSESKKAFMDYVNKELRESESGVYALGFDSSFKYFLTNKTEEMVRKGCLSIRPVMDYEEGEAKPAADSSDDSDE